MGQFILQVLKTQMTAPVVVDRVTLATRNVKEDGRDSFRCRPISLVHGTLNPNVIKKSAGPRFSRIIGSNKIVIQDLFNLSSPFFYLHSS